MSTQSVVEVLKKALELLGPNGEKWFKGWYSDGKGNRCCLGAINQASPTNELSGDAARTLSATIDGMSVGPWNDAPERTFLEVAAKFREAIELAKREGQ